MTAAGAAGRTWGLRGRARLCAAACALASALVPAGRTGADTSVPAPVAGEGSHASAASRAASSSPAVASHPAGAPAAAAEVPSVASAPAPSDAQPAATPAPSAPAAAALSPAGVKGIRKEIAAGKGAPLLVNFWATWCEPCVQELPDLGTIESRYAAKHVHVLGVSLDLMMEDDSPEVRRSVSKTLAEAGARYPNLLYNGRGDPLIEAFDLPGPIPHSILFGADGRELHRWTGRLSMADLERVLSKL